MAVIAMMGEDFVTVIDQDPVVVTVTGDHLAAANDVQARASRHDEALVVIIWMILPIAAYNQCTHIARDIPLDQIDQGRATVHIILLVVMTHTDLTGQGRAPARIEALEVGTVVVETMMMSMTMKCLPQSRRQLGLDKVCNPRLLVSITLPLLYKTIITKHHHTARHTSH